MSQVGGEPDREVSVSRNGSRRVVPWLLLAALAFGTWVRLHQLHLQIPADDEFHALHSVVRNNILQIAADFGDADRCIPLTLFYEIAAETVGLGDFLFRLPVVAAGLGILLLPLLLAGWSKAGTPSPKPLSPNTLTAWAWLMAVSPLLIFFSRYARPYSIAVLLSLAAVWAFYRWWTGAPRRWILFYAFAATGAAYFHLSAAFFVTAPFAFALLDLGLGSPRRRLRDVLAWGGATAAMMAFLLGPPLLHRSRSLTGKLSVQSIDADTLDVALTLLAGSRFTWIVVLLAVLAAFGLHGLARRFPRPAAFVALAAAAQVAGVLTLGPMAIDQPIVFVRYNLVLLPLLLLAAAQGTARLERLVRRGWRRRGHLSNRGGGAVEAPAGTRKTAPSRQSILAGWPAPFLAGLLLWAGPLPKADFHPNQWTNHSLFNATYDLLDPRFSYLRTSRPKRVSDFYQTLADQPPSSLRVLETPWYYQWPFNHYVQLQYRHRQLMMIGFVDESGLRYGELPPHDPRFRFRHFAHLAETERIRQANIDYIILHKDLTREVAGSAAAVNEAPVPDMSRWLTEYRRQCGPPVYEDDLVAVFKPQDE
ncbi:MAG TPA: hypothetical protein VLV83_25510 [Acidobacteriota bacterium]|nr:hypothetical protein [Acidobacteriota bacterium]